MTPASISPCSFQNASPTSLNPKHTWALAMSLAELGPPSSSLGPDPPHLPSLGLSFFEAFLIRVHKSLSLL